MMKFHFSFKLQSKREIKYGTTAVVTDPHVWFGGKVVPWDKTPFGEVL